MGVLNQYHLGTVYSGITKQKPLLYKYQYILEFVGGNGFWDSGIFKTFTLFDNDDNNPDQNFTYWAQGATVPAFEIPAAKVPFYASEFRVPGCMKYTHDFSTKILLDQDLTIYNKLDTWLKMISRLQLSGGGIKVIPTIKLRIRLLDSEHQYFTTSFILDGVYIKELGQIGLEYKSGDNTIKQVDVKFGIQYYYQDPDPQKLQMDPLSQAKILAAYGEV